MNFSHTFWFTGLSGAGKTTLAEGLATHYRSQGIHSVVLDGDALRNTLSNDLSFNEADRLEQNRRAAGIATLLNAQGIVVFAALISPTTLIRDAIKQQMGEGYLHFIHVDCSLEGCIRRDVKKYYVEALKEKNGTFTGIHQTYEIPVNPWVTIQTEHHSLEENLLELIKKIDPLILE